MKAQPHRSQPSVGVSLLCVDGDHQLCEDWLEGAAVDVPGARLGERRCGCGCHSQPWPFEHADT